MDFLYQLNIKKYINLLEQTTVFKESGKITKVTGTMLEGFLPGGSIGSQCIVYGTNQKEIPVEIVGIQDERVVMMPYTDLQGVRLGSPILLTKSSVRVKVGDNLLGRVIDARGVPLDKKGKLFLTEEVDLYQGKSNPLDRKPIKEPIDVGVRAINTFITVGEGQRIAIMAGSGVGKSVLLGMMARNTSADVNVIALIGERGREVRDFIEETLGEEGMKRSVVIVATSDDNPLIRTRGAYLAAAVAEYFANSGKKVLLTLDSITRFAMAQREMGLAAGEPPTTKGYTPSVFSQLPKILERAGNFEGRGSITGLYTVLVEGDDMDDPIADSVRSIVDGHIVLSRKLAERAHFPSIDVLASTSRLMRNVSSPEYYDISMKLRELLSIYKDAEDLIQLGAYQEGTNQKLDLAISLYPHIITFLKQKVEEQITIKDCHKFLDEVRRYL